MAKQCGLYLIYTRLSRIPLWGALLAKIWWEGARKHFIRPGLARQSITKFLDLLTNMNATKRPKENQCEMLPQGKTILMAFQKLHGDLLAGWMTFIKRSDEGLHI